MKLRFCTLTILVLTTTTLFGQVIEKCDRATLLSTSNKIGQLTQKQIEDFLLTFGKECRNNVEYSEWSNELLFSLLDKQTELTLKTIEKEENKIEKDEILIDLSEPIHDTVVLKNLISKIDKVKINGRLKKEILERLKTADDKLN
jgi:hypothetical protein